MEQWGNFCGTGAAPTPKNIGQSMPVTANHGWLAEKHIGLKSALRTLPFQQARNIPPTDKAFIWIKLNSESPNSGIRPQGQPPTGKIDGSLRMELSLVMLQPESANLGIRPQGQPPTGTRTQCNRLTGEVFYKCQVLLLVWAIARGLAVFVGASPCSRKMPSIGVVGASPCSRMLATATETGAYLLLRPLCPSQRSCPRP
jgi:hypothetical protein